MRSLPPRSLALVFAGLATVLGVPIPAAAQYSGGDGTVESPFLLATEDDWRQLAGHPEHWGSHFTVTKDVVFSPEVMPCIGTSKLPFSGFLDGGGHRLQGLVSDGRLDARAIASAMPVPNPRRGGLFGTVSGVVQDLWLVDPVVAASLTGTAGALAAWLVDGQLVDCHASGGQVVGETVGGLVGRVSSGQVLRCSADCFVTGQLNSGGLVGQLQAGALQQCKASSWVVGQAGHAGGLVAISTGYVKDCYSESVLVCSNDEVILGGLIGYHSGTVEDCYASSRFLVWTLVYSGGLFGKNLAGGNYWNTFWNQDLSPARRAVGNPASDRGTTTAAELANRSFLEGSGWEFVDAHPQGAWTLTDGVDLPRLAWEGGIQAPTADAGMDQVVAATGPQTLVLLDGSGSTDPDGRIVRWRWRWRTGEDTQEVEGKQVAILLPVGTTVIELQVFDGSQWSAPDPVVVTVLES